MSSREREWLIKLAVQELAERLPLAIAFAAKDLAVNGVNPGITQSGAMSRRRCCGIQILRSLNVHCRCCGGPDGEPRFGRLELSVWGLVRRPGGLIIAEIRMSASIFWSVERVA